MTMVSQGNDRRNYGEGGQSRIVGHGNHRSEGMSRRERRRQPEYPPTPMDEGRDRLVESVRQNANTILIGETGSGKPLAGRPFCWMPFPVRELP